MTEKTKTAEHRDGPKVVKEREHAEAAPEREEVAPGNALSLGGTNCAAAAPTPPPRPKSGPCSSCRAAGNLAVQSLLRAGAQMSGYEVSEPGDPYEREADAVAESVVGGSSNAISAAPALSAHGRGGVGVYGRTLSGGAHGRPLGDSARAYFEPRMGRDFGHVRVHTDERAAGAARALGARAFTLGGDIYFGQNLYAPETTQGRRLIAHELTHVAQQTGGATKGPARGLIQRDGGGGDTPAGTAQPTAPSTAPPDVPQADTGPGEHANQQAGTWGLWDKTPLTTGARLKEDFPTLEASVAYGRSLGKALAIYSEGTKYVIYPISYSAIFYSFTYSGTRMYRTSNITDVMGTAGVLAFVTEDGTPIYPHEYGSEKDYKAWMEQQNALKPGENPFDSHKEAFGEGLGKITGKDQFLNQFYFAMRDTAISMLDKSQAEAVQKRDELKDGMPAKDLATIRRVAKEVEEVDKQLTKWRGRQSSLRSAVENPVPFDDGFNERALNQLTEATQKVADLEVERRRILLDYPLLSQVNPAEFNQLSEEQQGAALRGATHDVLLNIETTRNNVTSGSLNLWTLGPLVETTLAGLGIADEERKTWAHDKMKSEQHWDMAVSIALGVLQIGLSIAATAVGGPAGVAFAVGALGVGVADAARMTEQYLQEKAAANTDINREAALVPKDIDGQWVWVVVAWVGVGLSFLEAVKAVRVAKMGAKTMEELVRQLSKETGIAEDVLLKAAGQAGKHPPDPAALRKILLSALPAELARESENIAVKVLKEEEFLKRFGSATGDAVTTFNKGPKGELIPEVFFKEGGNPLRMREEAVHVAQAADKTLAPKIAELTEANLANWGKMPEAEKLRLYRVKIELEIDAQEKLLKQFANEPNFVEEVQQNLDALRNRLGQVDELAQHTDLIKEGKVPWWDPEQAPRLFGKRMPKTGGTWSGTRGESLWYSDNPKVKAVTGGEGVPFKNGDPVFTKWAKAEVPISVTGNNTTDLARADRALAAEWAKTDPATYLYHGEPNASAVKRWRIQNGYTWHHHENGTTMQLVSTDLNGGVPHVGGASGARKAAAAAAATPPPTTTP
ncbi:MAG: DUF4157 domain-containing protein [Acidobacteria bacterium]|nr:DUF4157 domain-containing protein [Acidobacteriota bacterium]